MKKIIDKVPNLKTAMLRGFATYEMLIDYLVEKNIPLNSFETFVAFIVTNFYNNDDYFAILTIIHQNKNAFEDYDKENLILQDILKEMMNDCIKFKEQKEINI